MIAGISSRCAGRGGWPALATLLATAPPLVSGARNALAILLASAALLGPGARAAAQNRPADDFSHEPHREVTCISCHRSVGGRLGAAPISAQQCQSCHHSGPAAARCTRCHQATELSRPYSMTQQFQLSFAPQPVTRPVVFEHQRHEDVACGTCHPTSPGTEVGTLACAGCHEQHHAPDVGCQFCHASKQTGAHRNGAHLTCAGSGCHRASPVPASARTRPVCLACHAERAQHYPATNCADCHVLPMSGARNGAAGR